MHDTPDAPDAPEPSEPADTLDAGLSLLDRQVIDADGQLLGKVDDLLFVAPAGGGPPELTALLMGQQAFGHRLGGRLGRAWTALAARLGGRPGPVEVPIACVSEIGTVVRLNATAGRFPALRAVERGLRGALIGRLPGAGRDRG